MSNTYPRDYIEWCFGTANNISEYTKAKQLELMEKQAAYEQAEYDREYEPPMPIGTYYQHPHEQGEPVPAHQVSTDIITTLLENAA